MNPRTSLTILGIIIIILGIFPLASKAIPVSAIQNFPVEAGSVVYQAILVLVGIIALALSGQKKSMPQIIMQK
jgi:hypothetical protein